MPIINLGRNFDDGFDINVKVWCSRCGSEIPDYYKMLKEKRILFPFGKRGNWLRLHHQFQFSFFKRIFVLTIWKEK